MCKHTRRAIDARDTKRPVDETNKVNNFNNLRLIREKNTVI